MLFVVDFHQREELEEQVSVFLERLGEHSESAKKESGEELEEVRRELSEKFYAVVEHMEELDAKIAERSQGWDIKRLVKTDITILRLAIYELFYDEAVPVGVAVNEAVELAKRFGTDKSPSFINGILGTIVRKDIEE